MSIYTELAENARDIMRDYGQDRHAAIVEAIGDIMWDDDKEEIIADMWDIDQIWDMFLDIYLEDLISEVDSELDDVLEEDEEED